MWPLPSVRTLAETTMKPFTIPVRLRKIITHIFLLGLIFCAGAVFDCGSRQTAPHSLPAAFAAIPASPEQATIAPVPTIAPPPVSPSPATGESGVIEVQVEVEIAPPAVQPAANPTPPSRHRGFLRGRR